MDNNDGSQRIVGGMINELLDHVECANDPETEEVLLATLLGIIDSHGQSLPLEKRERLVEQAQLVQAFLKGYAKYDEAKETGDPAVMRLWREEIDQIAKVQAEHAAFLNFTYAAEQLCKAKSIDEFKVILPSVPLDRTYGHASSTKQVSPFPLIWAISARRRKPARVATVAMANKTARIVWAVLTRNEPYSPRSAA